MIYIFIVLLIILLVIPICENFDFSQGRVCNDVYYMEIDDFLTHDQCDSVMQAASDKGLFTSEIGLRKGGVNESIRKSSQQWLDPSENDTALMIKQKTAHVFASTGCIDESQYSYEQIQVVKYEKGGKYDPHYDGDLCDNGDTQCTSNMRIATLLIYLNDDYDGGTTKFPNLGIDITPKKGKALFFWVADPLNSLMYQETLHGGMEIKNGEKWIATQWIRTGGL